MTPRIAIKQLTEEQVRSWSIEQKDRWWLDNVYRGNMPQFTLRSGLAGMALSGILSLTNLYVGMRTGWTLGVGITSVIVAFTFFKIMQSIGAADEFTVLENNCMQSIAMAAGYMTSPLIASLAAYMMITGTVIPMGTTIAWTDAQPLNNTKRLKACLEEGYLLKTLCRAFYMRLPWRGCR